MSAHSLPGSMFDAYMAGKYAADVEHYMSQARRDSRPVMRCHWVQAARRANRRVVDLLRRARGVA